MRTFKLTNQDDVTQVGDLDQEGNIFFCLGNRTDLIKSLQKATSKAKIVGCSTASTIMGNTLINPEEALVVHVLMFEKTASEVYEDKFDGYDDSYDCGQRLALKFSKKEDLSGVIILSEGLLMNSVDFAKGLSDSIGLNIPVMGGLAADNLKFTKTFVFDEKNIYDQSVIAVAFYGKSFHMKTFSGAGIKSFGIERQVTKAVKSTVYEIDGKPALDVYESYLGEQLTGYQNGKELNFPIEISENFETKDGLIRTPLIVDVVKRTITFTAEIPENSTIRLMLAVKSDLILAAESVDLEMQEYVQEHNIQNYDTLIISCAARRIVMGEEAHMELPSKRNRQFGFYAYGEFTPINTSCDLVNQTFTQGIFYEK
jgi:hypothetical protein